MEHKIEKILKDKVKAYENCNFTVRKNTSQKKNIVIKNKKKIMLLFFPGLSATTYPGGQLQNCHIVSHNIGNLLNNG